MGGSNSAMQAYVLSRLALHAELHPPRADYVGIEGHTPVDAPMRRSSHIKKENRSWMTDTELAGTAWADVELVRTAGLRLWQSGKVECSTIRRTRRHCPGEMWRMAFRLPASEQDRAFCAAWDEWFSARDETVFKAVCKILTGS